MVQEISNKAWQAVPRRENLRLKELVAEISLQVSVLKKAAVPELE